MNLGDFRLYSLSDGFFGLDGGAMFGVVPKPLWERTNPPDERNRIRLALRPLLVVAGEDRVLIDTGIGDKWDAKNTDIYRIEHTDTIELSLARAGFKPEDITKVVLTHLHFDHAGGGTKLDSTGKPVPRFSNARYYVQQKEWDIAVNPNRRSRAAYLPENFTPLRKAGQLEIVDGNVELVPGLELVLTGGHTPGHQIVTITEKSEFRNQKPEFRIADPTGRTRTAGHLIPGSLDPLIPVLVSNRMRNRGIEGQRDRVAAAGHLIPRSLDPLIPVLAVFWGDLIPTRSHIATPYIMGYDLIPLETMEQKEKLVQQAVSGKWVSFLEHDPDFACGVIEEEDGKPFLARSRKSTDYADYADGPGPESADVNSKAAGR